MMRLLSKRWVQIMLLLFLLGGMVALRMQDPDFIRRTRQLTFDTYNKLIPRTPGEGVVIVDIDEDSLRRYGQWPWPRPLIGEMLEALNNMGARVIAFDMVFAEADRTSPQRIADRLPKTDLMQPVVEALQKLPDNDHIFAKQIADLGNVVTGFVAANQMTGREPILKTKFLPPEKAKNSLSFLTKILYFATSLPEIVDSAAGNGSFTALPEEDSVIRRVPLLIGHQKADGHVSMYPALSLEAFRVALKRNEYILESSDSGIQSVSLTDYTTLTDKLGVSKISIKRYEIPTDENGYFYVHYAGHRKELYIPVGDILTGKVPKDNVNGKIVFIGTSAIGLKDLRGTPLNADVPGVEIHAEIVEQILGGQFLKRPASFIGAELCAMVAVSLFIIFLAPFIGAGTLAFLVVILIGTAMVGSLYAYRHYGLMLDPVYPMISIVFIFILSSILTNLRSELERRAVRNAFSFYISPALMEELTSDPDKLKLGGEVRDMSVMFTDIRNFTTISESMDPGDLIKMMNDFLTPMTSCVLNNRGTIDKYMGDAMMAFWNAPLDDPEHVRHACLTALQMLASLEEVNVHLRAQAEKTHKPYKELKAGIGIHTGRCSVGNMGSKQRFAYSAIGDTVNLASRLEGQTKNYGVSVIITAEVQKQAPEFAVVEIDLLTVKGRAAPERIYTLLGDAAMAATEAFRIFAGIHGRMLEAYRGQRWDEAESLSVKCQELRPDLAGLYAVYKQRIADFRAKPPEAGWQGVWIAKDK